MLNIIILDKVLTVAASAGLVLVAGGAIGCGFWWIIRRFK